MTKEDKICQNCKKSFTIELEDFNFYEKIGVSAPIYCPNCRQQLRTIFRNFKTLYKRPSSKSGEIMVSIYSPDTTFPVYSVKEWWGDDWDPMNYAVDYDEEIPFFKQVEELFSKVPHATVMNTHTDNCEYSNQIDHSKNCYLMFGALDDEECDYSHIVWNSRFSVDNLYLFKSEFCYECIDCLNSAQLFYSQECDGCVDSIGLFDCRSCTNCIGCVGQVSKSYHIFNKPVSKEEYKAFLEQYPLHKKSSIDYILGERDKLRAQVPQRPFFGFRNNNVSGNHIYNARNVQHSFDIKSGENSKYCYTVRKTLDSFDLSFTGDAEECYQSMTVLGSSRAIGSMILADSRDVLYSEHCYNSHDLIGCYGLRKKSYCILNKQYSKEEYEELKNKIIESLRVRNEWGLFLPKEMSPFAYNEAIVNEYMPLSKEEALAKGFRWKDDIPETRGQGTIKYSDLPTYPNAYSDSLMKETLTCENCDRNFKLINREINFYKKFRLSLPANCFNCRHAARMSKRNPRDLWKGKCASCSKEIFTSYRPEDQSKYPIYCESCYNKEVY